MILNTRKFILGCSTSSVITNDGICINSL